MAAAEQPVYGQYDSASGGYTAIGGPQINSTQVIATVTHGPPIIIDPKTGKPYPPNYVPNEQAPGTHEMWTPGSSWAEGRKLAAARLDEYNRAAIEAGLRPREEELVKKQDQLVTQYGQAVTKFGTEFGKDPGKAISNLIGGGGAQLAGAATKAGSQIVQSGQQLAGQAVNTGQQLMGKAGITLGGGAVQSKSTQISGAGSALVSVAPARPPERTPRAGFSRSPSYSSTSSSSSPSTFSRTPRLN